MELMPEILQRLAEPFPANVIKWRAGSTTGDKSRAMALAYIDARDVMDRLDATVGGEWESDRGGVVVGVDSWDGAGR